MFTRLHKIAFASLAIVSLVGGSFGGYQRATSSSRLQAAFVGTNSSFRWRDDDGTEAAATFALPENVNLNRFKPNEPRRLRFSLDNYAADSGPVKKAAVSLNTGETISSSLIDAANGYAYVTTNQALDYAGLQPGKLVKVALGVGNALPVRLGETPFVAEEGYILFAEIDAANGYAYFYTYENKLIKFSLGEGDALPVRIGAVDFEDDGYTAHSGVFDTTHGYAYFHSSGWLQVGGDRIVKYSLGEGDVLPARIGALTLNEDENFPFAAAVIDSASGYAYFGVGTATPDIHTPGKIVKISLGTGDALPTRVGALILNEGEAFLSAAVIDPGNGYAYFETRNIIDPGKVVKVALGVGVALPTRVGAMSFSGLERMWETMAVIDTASGYAYFGFEWTEPTAVVKVALGIGATLPSEVGTLVLDRGESAYLQSMVIDSAHGKAYIGVGQSIDHFVKISLGAGDALPTRIGALDMTVGEDNIFAAVIDEGNGYAYFSTCTMPGQVVKVRLGVGDDPPVSVGSTLLNSGEDCPRSAVIDTDAGYAYFGTSGGNSSVIKIALNGDGSPTRIGAVAIGSDAASAVIDSAAGYAYFGTLVNSVVKVALGEGDDPPTVVGTVVFNNSNESNLSSAVIDPTAGYAYFGTGLNNIVVKIALGAGDASPTRVGALTLNNGENVLKTAVIDTAKGYAYFGTGYGRPNERVVKIALGAGAAAPTRVGAVTVNEPFLGASVIDTADDYVYFISAGSRVIKIAEGDGDTPPFRIATVALMTDNDVIAAVIDQTNKYIYMGTGGFPAAVVKASYANNSDVFRLEYGEKGTVCNDIVNWIQVPTTATYEVFQMQDSPNITDGEPTTNVPGGLTDPSGQVFVPGEIKDTDSETSPIILHKDEFTELEYSIASTTNAKLNANYCLRLTNAGASFLASENSFVEVTVLANTTADLLTNVPGIAIPGRPAVSLISPTEIRLVIDPNGNAATVVFWIHDVISGKYVQSDGSLGDTPVVKTFADWGGDDGVIIKVKPNTRYKFRVAARPGA